jgi:hypothetical protein
MDAICEISSPTRAKFRDRKLLRSETVTRKT